jgi:Rrf2 family iron-sulfur cluster assembly transcriptional regulator
MKVGSKGRYAVVAVMDVATHGKDSAVSLADVAARQNISLSYLEQLFAMLRRNGLVVSSRGPGGGYRLARPADETTIRAVFEAVDESAARAGQNGHSTKPAAEPGGELAEPLWQALSDRIGEFLESVTLADVIAGRVSASGIPAGRRPQLSQAAE